jgi:hypothetical protein
MEGVEINKKGFFIVLIEGVNHTPNVKHDDYQTALDESIRLSVNTNKTTYVLSAVAECKQVSSISNFKTFTL